MKRTLLGLLCMAMLLHSGCLGAIIVGTIIHKKKHAQALKAQQLEAEAGTLGTTATPEAKSTNGD